jgi:hypothetical protein
MEPPPRPACGLLPRPRRKGAVNGITRIPTGPERDIRIPRSAGEPRGASCSIQPDTQTRMREESPRTLDRGDIASGGGAKGGGPPPPPRGIPGYLPPPHPRLQRSSPSPQGQGPCVAITPCMAPGSRPSLQNFPLKTRIQLSYPQSIPLSEVLNESPHTNRGLRPPFPSNPPYFSGIGRLLANHYSSRWRIWGPAPWKSAVSGTPTAHTPEIRPCSLWVPYIGMHRISADVVP